MLKHFDNIINKLIRNAFLIILQNNILFTCRLTDEELRELMNAANKAKPVAAVPPYQNYILNSLTERVRLYSSIYD